MSRDALLAAPPTRSQPEPDGPPPRFTGYADGPVSWGGLSLIQRPERVPQATPQPARVSLAELRGLLEIAPGELWLDLRFRSRCGAEQRDEE